MRAPAPLFRVLKLFVWAPKGLLEVCLLHVEHIQGLLGVDALGEFRLDDGLLDGRRLIYTTDNILCL